MSWDTSLLAASGLPVAQLADVVGHTTTRMTEAVYRHRIEPSPNRSEVTWSDFVHSQAAVARDFFTVDTALLRRYNVAFFTLAVRSMRCYTHGS